ALAGIRSLYNHGDCSSWLDGCTMATETNSQSESSLFCITAGNSTCLAASDGLRPCNFGSCHASASGLPDWPICSAARARGNSSLPRLHATTHWTADAMDTHSDLCDRNGNTVVCDLENAFRSK